LRLKAALVDRLVRAAVTDAPPAHETIPGTEPGDPWGYRHKVHFVFGNAPHLVMGHYERGSRRIIPVRECPVHDPRGNQLAFDLRDAYARAGVFAAAARSQSSPASRRHERRSGVLRSVAIRVGANTSELMATLVVVDDSDKRLRSATRPLVDRSTGFHLNLHPRGDAFIFGRETRRLAGTERVREEVTDTSFLISPTAFFQTNVHAAGVLVRLVLDAVPDGADVLDLYAGVGLFALPLAKRGHRVVAVEENREAVGDGEASVRLNRIAPARCHFIARPVEAALTSTPSADVVILDPPREGCAASVITQVFGRLRPRRAIYVSCNPDALARDLRLIARDGYSIASIQPVDMFPHTAHVETIAILDRW
jgi:23S rRNA (uracil1939-C5)-methyltransferase